MQRGEGAVAGAGAGGDGDGGPGGEEQGGGVDVEDAEKVAAEVGEDEVRVGGVDDGLVRVGAGLAAGDGAGAVEGEVEDLGGAEGGGGGGEAVGGEAGGVVRDDEELGAVGGGVEIGVDGGGEGEGAVDEGEGAGLGVEFEGIEGAVQGGHAFVDAVEVVVRGVEVQPGGVGLAGVVGLELGEVVGAVGFGEVQGGDDAGVGGDVELRRGSGGDQRRGGECGEEHCSGS